MKLTKILSQLVGIFFLSSLFIHAQTSAPPSAQPPPQKPDDPTLRIETELVQVEVVVTDKAGKIIRDLRREDFELKADNKPQDVGYFSVGTATNAARWVPAANSGTTARTEKNVPVTPTPETRLGRHIVLAVDDWHIAFGNLVYTKQALLKFINEQTTVADQVALITTSGQLGLHEQFTNDRAVLRRAINRLTLQQRSVETRNFDVPRVSVYQAELIESHDPDALSLAVNEIMQKMPGTTRDMAVSQAQGKARQVVAENNSLTKATLGTLENTIRSLRTMPGRKTMVLLSDGFLLGGFAQSLTFDLRKITDAATRAGVVIYSMDTRGLIAATESFDASSPGFGIENPPGARLRMESAAIEADRDGLHALAYDTGGFAIFNNNDLSIGLGKIVSDTEYYYWLGFEPAESYRDGRFRKLEVRIKNHPDYKIRYNKGYFAPDDKAVAKSAEKDEKEKIKLAAERLKNPEKAAKKEQAMQSAIVREALSSLFPQREIPVEMAVLFTNSGTGESLANIQAHLDVSKLKFEQANDRYNTNLEVVCVVFDEKGNVVDSFSQKVAMALRAATYEKTRKAGLLFARQEKLPAGFYQIRLAAIKENSRQFGTASEWIEIADLSKKQLTLSSIFLTAENETIKPPTLSETKPEEEKKIEDQPALSIPAQIARRFKRGKNFDYTIFAYQPKTDDSGNVDVTLQTQIFAGNKLALATPPTKLKPLADQKDGNSLAYAARVVTANFAPGNYELRIVVVDNLAKITTNRRLNFTVEP